jgi:hypothetical protein
VTGNIHERDHTARGQAVVDEAQSNGDTSAAFLWESIEICTGERSDQAGLAMVDVPSGADDPMAPRHGLSARETTKDLFKGAGCTRDL